MGKVPKHLQGVLWSVDVNQLDLEKNKGYIINQILGLGTLENLHWLFKTYPKEVIRETFINKPSKVYTPAAFNFCKNILLDIRGVDLPPNKYVWNLPRDIRS